MKMYFKRVSSVLSVKILGRVFNTDLGVFPVKILESTFSKDSSRDFSTDSMAWDSAAWFQEQL